MNTASWKDASVTDQSKTKIYLSADNKSAQQMNT